MFQWYFDKFDSVHRRITVIVIIHHFKSSHHYENEHFEVYDDQSWCFNKFDVTILLSYDFCYDVKSYDILWWHWYSIFIISRLCLHVRGEFSSPYSSSSPPSPPSWSSASSYHHHHHHIMMMFTCEGGVCADSDFDIGRSPVDYWFSLLIIDYCGLLITSDLQI